MKIKNTQDNARRCWDKGKEVIVEAGETIEVTNPQYDSKSFIIVTETEKIEKFEKKRKLKKEVE